MGTAGEDRVASGAEIGTEWCRGCVAGAEGGVQRLMETGGEGPACVDGRRGGVAGLTVQFSSCFCKGGKFELTGFKVGKAWVDPISGAEHSVCISEVGESTTIISGVAVGSAAGAVEPAIGVWAGALAGSPAEDTAGALAETALPDPEVVRLRALRRAL